MNASHLFGILTVLLVLLGGVARANAQDCADLHVEASDEGDAVVGYGTFQLTWASGCNEYYWDLDLLQNISGPAGFNDSYVSGWPWISTSVSLPVFPEYDHGTYSAEGHANAYYGENELEYHFDDAQVTVLPPTSCSTPGFLGLNRGLVPNGGYTYRVFAGFNVGESDGIDEAITRWALTYAVGAWFVETGSDNADIRFVRAPGSQLPPGAYGGIGYWIYWEDMTVRIVQIRFSDFTGHATGQPGVRRLALHELGHVHGLVSCNRNM
jgi:hypothetical protein